MAEASKKYVTKQELSTIETTWSNLKSLRDSSALTPGMQYRIIDYVTTTIRENTQSAGHQFDVIVVADDNHTLNENARACLHAGDTYFSGAKLGSWELKYCIDNDATRFTWADTGSTGRGVIYYMKDEWNNECSYDFKNIQFKRYKITSYTGSGGGNVGDALVYSYSNPIYYGGLGYAGLSVEFPNNFTVDTSDYIWYYTFSGLDSNKNVYDISSNQFKLSQSTINEMEFDGGWDDTEDSCYDNIIPELCEECFGDDMYFKGRIELNNIVFIGDISFDDGYYNDYSVTSIHSNKFGSNCSDCTFGGKRCSYNTFGNYCCNNTFGNDPWFNTFGDRCTTNTFSEDCYNNTFGCMCSNNIFGNSCSDNIFGNSCYNNIFGNHCYGNTFLSECTANIFGNSCFYNFFGNYVHESSFENYCSYNTIGNGCDMILIQKSYVYNIIVENGNKLITITSTQTTSVSNVLRNFTISQGVNNGNTTKTISHNTTNNTFKTTYQNSSSKITNI